MRTHRILDIDSDELREAVNDALPDDDDFEMDEADAILLAMQDTNK